MLQHESLSQLLHAMTTATTRFRPTNSVLVNNGLRVAELYVESAELDRRVASSEALPQLRKKLLAISSFMAEEAMHTNDPKWIRGAVLLHVIEDLVWDYRESLRRLILAEYAATMIGVSMRDVIDAVMPYASNRTSEFLKEFRDREGNLKELASLGVEVKLIHGRLAFMPATIPS